MTLRWVVFFLVMAVINEIVWRNFSEAAWVNFKVFGILPLTHCFRDGPNRPDQAPRSPRGRLSRQHLPIKN